MDVSLGFERNTLPPTLTTMYDEYKTIKINNID
jgi:hypothetical protein